MERAAAWRAGGSIREAAVSCGAAVADHLAVIRALVLRNLRLQSKSNPLGLFVEFLRPVAICLAHYFYFTLTERPVPGHQYAIFTIGGFAIYFTFAAAYAGTFDAGKWPGGVVQMPGVTRMHLRLARVFWAFLLHVVFAVLVLVPLWMLGMDIGMPNLPLTMTCFALAAALGFGYGLITSAVGTMLPALVPFIKIAMWAVFITSGVYDSLVTMPRIMAEIIWYNPLIHLAEYQRHAYYAGYPVYLVSLNYALTWAAGLISTGLLMNRALCNRKRP